LLKKFDNEIKKKDEIEIEIKKKEKKRKGNEKKIGG
jgi:hypothetical protein